MAEHTLKQKALDAMEDYFEKREEMKAKDIIPKGHIILCFLPKNIPIYDETGLCKCIKDGMQEDIDREFSFYPKLVGKPFKIFISPGYASQKTLDLEICDDLEDFD